MDFADLQIGNRVISMGKWLSVMVSIIIVNLMLVIVLLMMDKKKYGLFLLGGSFVLSVIFYFAFNYKFGNFIKMSNKNF